VDTPTYISLYSGGGGLDIGFRLAFPEAIGVCYVERELTAAALLVDHLQTGQLDDAPVWSDANTFDGKPWRGTVDWVIGGPPCQPFSQAGERLAADDPRNGWPNTLRLVREIEPRFCFFENVASSDFLLYYWNDIKPGLRALGYAVEEILVKASDAGANHKRNRTFILAYVVDTSSEGREGLGHSGSTRISESRTSGTVRDTEPFAFGPEDTRWRDLLAERPELAPAVESSVLRVAYGMARGLARNDRIRILGNGVVPQQARLAIEAMIGAIKE